MPKEQIDTKFELHNLQPICSNDKDQDFFANILNIRLKQKQRCLKETKAKLESNMFTKEDKSIKTFEHVILPIIDYTIFGGAQQLQNKRHTITYDREQKRNTIEDALNVYTAYSSQLSWPEYFKLLKLMVYRLQRARRQVNSISTHGEPELEKEKIITKCICKVLAGFNQPEVPDALGAHLKDDDEIEEVKPADTWLTRTIKEALKEPIVKEEVDEQESEHQESDADNEEMEVEADKIKDIQSKLSQKILPILEKHLTDTKEKKIVRSFVAECYVKTIRKLPHA